MSGHSYYLRQVRIADAQSKSKVMIERYPEELLSWKFFSLVVTILTGAGIAMTTNNSGLDPSWWMLTVNATRFGLIQKSEFIGTYGPLGFLDFALVTWKVGLILNLVWKIFVTTWVFLKLWTLFSSNLKYSNFRTGLVTAIFVSSINYFLPTSQVLVVVILIIWVSAQFEDGQSRNSQNRQIFLLSLLTAVLFLVKLFPGTLALSLSLALILQGCFKAKISRSQAFIELIKYFTGVIALTSGMLLLLGFTFSEAIAWLYGSAQMTIGYKAMAWEDPGRLWEYIAFFMLITPLVLSFKKNRKSILLVMPRIVYFYFLFIYGFNRHDSHAIVSFSFITIEYILNATFRKQSKIFVSSAFSVIALLAVSGFSITQFFDFSTRLQHSVSYIKALDPRYTLQITTENIRNLQNSYPISKKMLNTVGRDSVSIYPWDQLAATAWNLNLAFPPAPQLITAYTPWLDQQNFKWVNSDQASKFMLWTQPKSIDYRYPHWDSPSFQVATICNYKQLELDESWLLLSRREKSVCGNPEKEFELLSTDNSQKNFRINPNEEKITVMRIVTNESVFKRFQRSIFKPIKSDSVWIDGTQVRFVWATKESMITHIPKEINYQVPYDYKSIQNITLKYASRIFLTEIPVNK
jgi:hypothetical protein